MKTPKRVPQIVLFQGDSHIKYFEYAITHNLLPKKYKYVTQIVPGATAHGLANPHSKTNALVHFLEKLNKEQPFCVVTHLGEVDCGFGIWHWHEKEGRPIEDQLNLSINNYIEYLKRAKKIVKHVIVTSPTLPTIKDGAFRNSRNVVANLRGHLNATQLERTQLTIQYDNILKTRCEEEGFIHIENIHELLNTRDVIDDTFLNTTAHDHHLKCKRISPIWANKLTTILNNI